MASIVAIGFMCQRGMIGNFNGTVSNSSCFYQK